MDRYLDEFVEDHLNGGYGNILDELDAEDRNSEEFPDFESEEPCDESLAQRELEDFEQADEYFGYFGGDDEW